jgi:hypothetical protein
MRIGCGGVESQNRREEFTTEDAESHTEGHRGNQEAKRRQRKDEETSP